MIDFLLRPLRRNFGRDKFYYRIVDDLFGFVPHNVELYKLALIHKSASLVLEDGRAINNERLEYLGDAVIEAVTSDYIFIEYPDRDEGFMTQLRSKIVSRQSLNALAVNLGLDRHVISNGGAGIAQKHIYGDAFEAMMGAVYLDQGYETANRVLIERVFPEYVDLEALEQTEKDFKSRVIEWGQKHHRAVEFHSRECTDALELTPHFECELTISGTRYGYGEARSKKEAEQLAAREAYEQLNIQ